MSAENNAIELLGVGGISTRAERRVAEEDAISQLFRPNPRFERGYSNAPKVALSPTYDIPPPAYSLPNHAPKPQKKRGRLSRKEDRGDQPPEYSCPHLMEGELDLKTELLTPFKLAKEHSWAPVYVVLRGPLLSIHRRAPHIITSEPQAGKMLKSYTLQNAEVGLADDCLRVELEPLNARARMMLPRNRWEAYMKDKSMFQKVKFYILRLRLEEEQILLSTHSKSRALAWLEALCSAMDIAPDIDERTDPRSFTETRNRARRTAGHLMRNRRLVREQERLFQEHYPQFAQERPEPVITSALTNGNLINDDSPTPPGDDDDEDQRDEENDDAENEEAAAQQHYPDWLIASALSSRTIRADLRQHNANPESPSTRTPNDQTSELSAMLPPSILHLRQVVHSPCSDDIDPETQKWRPQHPWTYRHDVLYRRKCLPVLVSNAPRASDVIIKDAKRFKIDWDKKVLIPLDAPIDLGIAEEKEDAFSSTRTLASPLLWRRKSPDATSNGIVQGQGKGNGTGAATGAGGNEPPPVARVATSSGSDSNGRSSMENDSFGSRRVSESADRAPGATARGDLSGAGNGQRRARRMISDLFRPKNSSGGLHGRASPIPEVVGGRELA
ncbi:MAG: hypothetical protein Q9165_007065 [Trypethelium subeluteriae]